MKTLAFLGIAHIHTPSFIKTVLELPDQFTLKAVWDDQPARAQIAAEHAGCAAVADYHDILRDEAIDAVIVCSETWLHRELVEAAAAARKHLFVEKPLGMGAEDAYAMQRAIDAAGVIFHIGHFMRSYPFNRVLKGWVEDGVLGAITRIRHCNVHHGAIGKWFHPGRGWYEDGWLWMTDAERSGCGGFGDLGAHSLDILMWLMGAVDSGHRADGSAAGPLSLRRIRRGYAALRQWRHWHTGGRLGRCLAPAADFGQRNPGRRLC